MKLISFSISNYKSFYTKQTIQFDTESGNVDAFFGPNGSGKSNLFDAMVFFKDFIRNSTSYKASRFKSNYFAFKLGAESLPTTFEAEMQTRKTTYLYCFALRNGVVVDEMLRKRKNKTGYETIFSRPSVEKNRYEQAGFDSALLRATRDNALLLTKAWENNNSYALEIFEWLDHFQFVDGDQPTSETAKRIMTNHDFKLKVLDLLKRADLFIQDITVSESKVPEVLNNLFGSEKYKDIFQSDTVYDVSTTHLVYDENNRLVEAKLMPMSSTESQGTMRIFELAHPILSALDEGHILYIDEFEHHLHPKECIFLVSLFNSPDNTSGAHLILNTHNTQIMDKIGRNNIHFVGKTSQEESVVSTVPKTVRIDDLALEKKYTKGLFGATPNIQ